MKSRKTFIALSLLVSGTVTLPAVADDEHHFPQGATFTILVKTPLNVEGMTGDNHGNLYTPGRQTTAEFECPVWRVDSNVPNPVLVLVGRIPAPPPPALCAPLGLAFDHTGKLFVTEPNGGKIFSFFPNTGAPPIATEFASGVPGANGVAFDEEGNLWTSDGTTGQGRVWMINPSGLITEVFRIQPMANSLNVGRQNSTLQPAQTPAAPPNPQPLVANGLAFDKDGDLFVSDTARGAIWKVKLDRRGHLRSRTGCETTFTSNTLCMENVFVAHPLLEGADGIALDRDGNIWVDANERNAIVVVTDERKVIEVFRNAPVAGLRNTGPLEFNTSPFLSDRKFCTASSDGNRRDNSPNTAGEIDNSTPPAGGPFRGKISCMDQRLHSQGVPLPVQ